jgi:hypothetical protein
LASIDGNDLLIVKMCARVARSFSPKDRLIKINDAQQL